MMFFSLRFSPLLLVVHLDENGPRGEGVRHDLRPGHVSCLNWCRPRLTSGLVSVVTDMSMVAGAVTHDVTHVALVLAAARLVSVGWLRSTPRNLDFHLGRCDGRLVRVRVRVKVGVRSGLGLGLGLGLYVGLGLGLGLGLGPTSSSAWASSPSSALSSASVKRRGSTKRRMGMQAAMT
eukprot:scaffold99722_cov54-Phaeocystis_antarctica.AAC.1